jgi:hypothetical protein
VTTESRRLKRVTKKEQQLIDLNTAPRVLTDREGDADFKILWSYVKELREFRVCDVHIIPRRSGDAEEGQRYPTCIRGKPAEIIGAYHTFAPVPSCVGKQKERNQPRSIGMAEAKSTVLRNNR